MDQEVISSTLEQQQAGMVINPKNIQQQETCVKITGKPGKEKKRKEK